MSDTRDIVERLRDQSQPIGDYCDSFQCDKVKEEAAAEIARLREERRWVPVGERLPEEEVDCLVFHEFRKEFRIAFLYKGDWWEGACRITGNVKHWMPLTPGPEGKA